MMSQTEWSSLNKLEITNKSVSMGIVSLSSYALFNENQGVLQLMMAKKICGYQMLNVSTENNCIKAVTN